MCQCCVTLLNTFDGEMLWSHFGEITEYTFSVGALTAAGLFILVHQKDPSCAFGSDTDLSEVSSFMDPIGVWCFY